MAPAGSRPAPGSGPPAHAATPPGPAEPAEPPAPPAPPAELLSALVGVGRLLETGGRGAGRRTPLSATAPDVAADLARQLAAPAAAVLPAALVHARPPARSAGAGEPLATAATAGWPPGATVTVDAGRATVTGGGVVLAGPAAAVVVDGREVGFVTVADRRDRSWSPAEEQYLAAAAQLVAAAWALEAASGELARIAYHDPLTGLPNRARIVELIDEAIARGRGAVAVVALDVDRFKIINDSVGRHAADDVLRTLSGRLRGALGAAGVLGRTEGDRFVAVFDDAPDDDSSVRLADKLRRALHTVLTSSGHELPITATAGVARPSGPDEDGASLLENAETAMFQAKGGGRGRTVAYAARHRDRAYRHLELELALRRAIERRELRLHYQPVLDLRTDALVQFEALARWDDPVHGPVSPREFVPIAEETGLIVPLGAWVLEEACRQAEEWSTRDGPPARVAVNLSAAQVSNRGLVELVASTLQATGLDAPQLTLEITETVLMSDAEGVMSVLRRLRGLGVGLSIDDFGTGYSSLSYLKRFPVDTLKIDQTFVKGLGTDPNDSAIVGATVRLSEALGLGTVAEGVENARQVKELLALGCAQAQGYFFARPAPASATAARYGLGPGGSGARSGEAFSPGDALRTRAARA